MNMTKQSVLLEEALKKLRGELGPDASVVKDFEAQLIRLRKAESGEVTQSELLEDELQYVRVKLGSEAWLVKDLERQLIILREEESRASG